MVQGPATQLGVGGNPEHTTEEVSDGQQLKVPYLIERETMLRTLGFLHGFAFGTNLQVTKVKCGLANESLFYPGDENILQVRIARLILIFHILSFELLST